MANNENKQYGPTFSIFVVLVIIIISGIYGIHLIKEGLKEKSQFETLVDQELQKSLDKIHSNEATLGDKVRVLAEFESEELSDEELEEIIQTIIQEDKKLQEGLRSLEK